MTDDQHGEEPRRESPQGSWERLPQGDYDDGATTFVQLPEGGIDALLASHTPLAAPGHGYVPPSFTPSPQQGEAGPHGEWGAPAEGTGWPEAAPGTDPRYDRHPQQGQPYEESGHDPRREQSGGDTSGHGFAYHPQSTGQWTFEEPANPGGPQGGPAPGHDVTGEWSIPVAGGDLPDESGEFTTSSLVEQWGGTPPPTLPGGAAAPWAPPESGDRSTEAPGGPFDGSYAPEGAASAPGGRQALQEPSTPADPARTDEQATSAYAGDHTGTDPYAPHDGPAPARQEPYAAPAPAGHRDPDTGADTGPARQPSPDVEPPVAEAAPQAPGATETAGTTERHREPSEPSASFEPFARPAPSPQPQEHPEQQPPAEDRAPRRRPARPDPDADARPDGPADAPGSAPEDPAAQDPVPEDRVPEDHASEDPVPAGAVPFPDEHPLVSYVLRVNGADRPVTDAWIGESLLYVLRERLGLAGAKDGCSEGECGACNVQVDGRLVASCLVPSVTAAGTEVRTVEGLAVDGQPSDVQRALARCGAVQCGFCVPGMAMTVHDLLEGNPDPTDLEARQALCGNLCRCSGYRGVLHAVREVVAEREALGAADEESGERTGDEAAAPSGGGEPLIPHQAGPGEGGIHHDQSYGQDGGQR
ncbi:(2Fe-2S)-binding protein [Streptomyces sp. B3I8]|uniref:(2Fe-2S)-binding protein n=1 Tax=Streptomyces sp. B3I8 TaxID=3042303 RepID=UPI002785C440|nr:(2Fe-2S)-binding protein [Streptomyces sp. B3I8]MDQ0787270.1 aerobic-type carbon monoxide dehydrogenase small subunit (CoxS/CutS family) [Streptomyces sp. B3I8]